MQVNEQAFSTFWYWCNERHSIYLRRQAGQPRPWTEDRVLQWWHFCNVFRRLDKQSAWLIDNVIEPHKDVPPELLLFNLFLFRAFNWYPTYEALGWQNEWHPWIAKRKLETIQNKGQFSSGAYMLRGRHDMPKYQSIVETLNTIWQEKKDLVDAILWQPTLQNTVGKILQKKFWGWGGFTAYQIALDLTYTPIMPNPADINTWCEFGPGAQRGMQLIYPGIKTVEMLPAARGLLLDSPKYWQHEPALNLQDIEFSLCELSKYVRIKNGGKGKTKYEGF